ncbi:MAG: hypothetical protein VCA36_08945 [Opitutales bacterium]
MGSMGWGAWFGYGVFRREMAEWRQRQALALLDQNKTHEALLNIQASIIAYPDDVDFLRSLTRAAREAGDPFYFDWAQQLAERGESTSDEVLVLVDDLMEAGDFIEAEKWLQVARSKGLADMAYAERALTLNLRAGRPGSLPALLIARRLVEDGSEAPEVASAYAGLSLMMGDDALRKEAYGRLRKWAVRKDDLGTVSLRWLVRFPELSETERTGLQAILANRLTEGKEVEDSRSQVLREVNLALSQNPPSWDDALSRVLHHKGLFSGAESKALEAAILWRKGSEQEARKAFGLAIGMAELEDFSLVESEVWATGDPLIAVTLLEKYAQRPGTKLLAEALLIPLRGRLAQYAEARLLANRVNLDRFRSLPEILAEVARWKVLLGEDDWAEATNELERLVSRFPLHPKYRRDLAFAYHRLEQHRMVLELVPAPSSKAAVLPRARAKALRFACLRKLGAETSDGDRLTVEELAILHPIERKLLGL